MDDAKRQEIAERILKLWEQEYACADSIMLTVGGHILGEADLQLVKAATPFVGGVACDHEDVCGAFVAGLMCIGLVHGREHNQDSEQPAYVLARRYRRWFLDAWGTTRCGPIRDSVHAAGGMGSCRYVARDAALVLVEILEEGDEE